VGSNPAFKVEEVRHLLQISGASHILVQESESRVIRQAARAEDIPSSNILKLEDFLASASLECLEQPGGSPNSWHAFDDVEEAKRKPAVLLMTSGTTGRPKLALMSHFAIVAQAAMAEWVYGESSAKVRLFWRIETMAENSGSKTHIPADVPFICASLPSAGTAKRSYHVRHVSISRTRLRTLHPTISDHVDSDSAADCSPIVWRKPAQP
jgi:acyl-CoA synthetase (AMP-forming)/AMP-acid ligase II